MTLNLNSEWNTYRALDADKVISNMFTVSDKDYYVGVVNSNTTCYNVTPEHVRAFYDVKERMEREVKEVELRKSQMQNKRLRAMVKKVIFNGDRTIIMWNDGTKTVTQCHELDAYDKEKGVLACMAKKLYENTNLFNEVVRAYVPEETGMNASIAETIEQQKLRIEYLEEQLEREAWAREDLMSDLRYLEDVKEELAEENRSLRNRVEDYLEEIEWLEEQLENRLDQ